MSLFPKKTLGIAAVEFTIIVSGVLVALAADAAVDARGERIAEGEYLEALKADVEADIAELAEYRLPSGEAARAAGVRIREVLAGSQTFDSVSVVQDIVSVANYGSFDAQTSTFEDLLSSGRLGLIRSQALRAQIQAYYNQVDDLATVDEAHRAQVLSAFRENVPRALRGGALSEAFSQTPIGRYAPSHQDLDQLRYEAARAIDTQNQSGVEALNQFLEVALSLFGKRQTMQESLIEDARDLVEALASRSEPGAP